jgi:hypothetical protein
MWRIQRMSCSRRTKQCGCQASRAVLAREAEVKDEKWSAVRSAAVRVAAPLYQ